MNNVQMAIGNTGTTNDMRCDKCSREFPDLRWPDGAIVNLMECRHDGSFAVSPLPATAHAAHEEGRAKGRQEGKLLMAHMMARMAGGVDPDVLEKVHTELTTPPSSGEVADTEPPPSGKSA